MVMPFIETEKDIEGGLVGKKSVLFSSSRVLEAK